MDLLCGRWDRRVDTHQNKWRLSLPSRTKEIFLEGILLREGKDDCIELCPVDSTKLKNPSSVFIEKLENGGRIVIPESLRKSTSFYYGQNVTIVGEGDCLVLWPRPEDRKKKKWR